jgi:hypothetical protein
VVAKEIERQCGVTYKCAWHICHELRKLMASADANRGGPLSGHVEIDESYVGGVAKGGPSQRMVNKTVVMGLIERGGRIVAGPVTDVSVYTLDGIVYEQHDHNRRAALLQRASPGLRARHDQSQGQRICARHSSREHLRKPLVAVKAHGEGHARSHFDQTYLEIRQRVQLSPQHAALTLGNV